MKSGFSNYLFFPFLSLILVLTIIFFNSSCKRKHELPPEEIIESKESADELVSGLIEDQLIQYKRDSLLIIDQDTLLTASWIYDFYFQNNFYPAWTKNEKLLNVADSLISFIHSSEEYGLSPEDYHINKLHDKIYLVLDTSKNRINATRIYEINMLLTDAFFRLAVHLNKGRYDSLTLVQKWKGSELHENVVEILRNTITLNKVRKSLESFEPKFLQYWLLRNHLKKLILKYKILFADSADKFNVLKSGYYSILSQIFFISGVYNSSLTAKVDSLQLQKANTAYQINQLIINLERWRMEIPLEDNYVFINIPSYRLNLIEIEKVIFTSKIIVGKPVTQTSPGINSSISHYFIYPYWIVPYSIATKEILPILLKDTSYLSNHNMEILDIKGKPVDGKTIKWIKYSKEYFPFTIRQRDGDENTLGVLKFIFDNKFGIYIHDTNSKTLFNNKYRALSHGCIRLENAIEFAREINNCCVTDFSSDSLTYYLKIKQRKKVNLWQPLPIHTRYYTCDADSENINFYEDVYQLDNELLKGLSFKFN